VLSSCWDRVPVLCDVTAQGTATSSGRDNGYEMGDKTTLNKPRIG